MQGEDIVSLVAMVLISGIGIYYLLTIDTPNPTIVLAVIGAVAGLGGYRIRKSR